MRLPRGFMRRARVRACASNSMWTTRDATRLNGSGLFVINPPWSLKQEAEVLLPALAERLSRRGYGAYRCEAFGPPP